MYSISCIDIYLSNIFLSFFFQLQSFSTITADGPPAHITVHSQGQRVCDVTMRFLNVFFYYLSILEPESPFCSPHLNYVERQVKTAVYQVVSSKTATLSQII